MSTIFSYIPYFIDKIIIYYILFTKKVKEITEKPEKSSPKEINFFTIFRSSCLQRFKVAERFTEKTVLESLFKLSFRLEACSFIRKEIPVQVFSFKLCAKCFRTPFLQSTSGRFLLYFIKGNAYSLC